MIQLMFFIFSVSFNFCSSSLCLHLRLLIIEKKAIRKSNIPIINWRWQNRDKNSHGQMSMEKINTKKNSPPKNSFFS